MRCESGASGWMSARSGFVVLGLCCYASGAVFIMRRTGGRVLAAEDGKSFPEIDGGQDVAGGRRARRVRVLPASAFCPGSTANSCSAIDAAAFLHRAVKPVSWLKLQDLLYFAQAWHLVWDNELLFPEAILATEDGVQIEAIEKLLSGRFEVTSGRTGRPAKLLGTQEQTLVGIAKHYASRSHYRLSELIREHKPWQEARAAASPGQPGVIQPAALYRYYRDS